MGNLCTSTQKGRSTDNLENPYNKDKQVSKRTSICIHRKRKALAR